jgi:hypothetical protein
MKIKTSELKDGILDWAVDKALNLNTPYNSWGQKGKVPPYSTNWAHGGPIIEREKIDLFTEKGTPESWVASVARYQNGAKLVGWRMHQYGPTPLIAAMRCYVASKLGDEVDVPDDVLKDAELDALVYDRGDE